MSGYSPLTKRLINEGLSPKAPLTEPQILLERIEEAMRPGTPVSFRRRVLGEAAAFIRQRHGMAGERAA